MKLYSINEIFYSLQGEGFYTGTPAVFLRFAGCNRKCPFCDTDHFSGQPMTAQQIVERLAEYPARHLVITGGEPTLQLDSTLLQAIKALGYYVQIETNGSLPVPPEVDWVACSPKDPPLNIDRIDELKIVYQQQDVEAIRQSLPTARVNYLQPCSGLNTEQTVAYLLRHPHWRLSLQTHKLINIQ